jgi:hypothetical protein
MNLGSRASRDDPTATSALTASSQARVCSEKKAQGALTLARIHRLF